MSTNPKYSIVVPVYNRPQEIDELLDSLCRQTVKDFDVVVVEDGSTTNCEHIIAQYSSRLTIHYYFKPNSGPGPSRNYGFEKATGQYFVVFDSDCIIPETYLESVEKALAEYGWDAWGGPDRGHEDFTLMQRAMGYTMSSILTTGGIRGGKHHMGSFQPRSFNMGISRKVYETTGGFKFDRYAEDIEFSIRMKKAGFKVGLIPEAYVFHKRRTNFKQFFRQVYNFGRGRIHVGKAHPGEVKITHWFPTVFTLGLIIWPFIALISMMLFTIGAIFLGMYFMAILIHSMLVTDSLAVGLLSVPSAIVQLTGYGYGFLSEKLKN